MQPTTSRAKASDRHFSLQLKVHVEFGCSSSFGVTLCFRKSTAIPQPFNSGAEAELLEGRIGRIEWPDIDMTKRTSSAARTFALRRCD